MNRRIAVGIPARNEADALPACVAALVRAADKAEIGWLHIVVLANNCQDGTASTPGRDLGPRVSLHMIEAELPPERAHAGWARRLALDAAFTHLRAGDDLLLSTDADTLVAEDWLSRTLTHFEAGYDAVAGLARLNPRDLRALPPPHRARLASLRRYDLALSYLKAMRDRDEPWPRHFYEGGASIALSRAAYQAIGGAPTPPVGEDKALFEAVRRIGAQKSPSPGRRDGVDVRSTGRHERRAARRTRWRIGGGCLTTSQFRACRRSPRPWISKALAPLDR